MKNCNLGLHNGRTSYRKSLQPAKKNIQHFKTCNFFTFFYICRNFVALLDPDPDPDPGPQIKVDPSGSGSTTGSRTSY
jgi:hypothetical protein